MELDALFSPRAVAVVGASSRKLTIGYRIIENLLDFGYAGSIYPISRKGGEILGLKAYPSILDAPEPIDVAHIVIRNTLVPGCIEDCAKKGVKAAIVNAAGFREIGEEGIALEKQIVDIAKRTGIRVFGPNCQGIINSDPSARAYCNFTFTRPLPGHISIVAQSGGVGEVIHQRIAELGIGVRKYASNGNACDVSIPEIIHHFGQDEETKVIVVHIESLPDPRAFLEVATEVCRRKPILGIMVGRTDEGAKAVSSHTGGLMKQDTAIELIFEKAGVVSFSNLEDLCQSAIGFSSQPIPAGNRVGMVTNTGGPAIIATDKLVEDGMAMPPLSKATETALREKLFPQASVNNPIDVLATAGPQHFAATINALMNDDGIDAIFLNFVTPFFVDTLGVAREIAEANDRSKKPIVATVMTEKKGWAETLKIIRDSGVPTYDMPETGAKVLASMSRYASFLRRPIDKPASFDGMDTARAQAIIKTARDAGKTTLSAGEAYDLLTCYGISSAPCSQAADPDECVSVAEKLGYPVALKIDAKAVVHKTDSGGVALNIADSDTLRRAAQEMADKFADSSPQFLVQKQLPPGLEVIVGANSVPGLGHVVMFGLGGIYVEVLKDVSFKLAPVTEREACEMLESLRASAILTGVRNQAGVDRPALIEIIQRLSQLLVDNPDIRELDLNPIFAYPTAAKAVDVRVLL